MPVRFPPGSILWLMVHILAFRNLSQRSQSSPQNVGSDHRLPTLALLKMPNCSTFGKIIFGFELVELLLYRRSLAAQVRVRIMVYITCISLQFSHLYTYKIQSSNITRIVSQRPPRPMPTPICYTFFTITRRAKLLVGENVKNLSTTADA